MCPGDSLNVETLKKDALPTEELAAVQGQGPAGSLPLTSEVRMEDVGRFLAHVLHDLRTPLTVVRGYLSLMRDETDMDTRYDFAARALRQLEFVESMSQQTLAYVRGEQELWVRRVHLQPFFEEMMRSLQDVFGSRSQLVLDLQDRTAAKFDPNGMTRVVHNLVRNAVQAAGKGWVNIALTVGRNEGDLFVRVQDSGPGLPDGVLEHGSGPGLGLPIVRSIVAGHGGELSWTSEPGKTVFCAVFPQSP